MGELGGARRLPREAQDLGRLVAALASGGPASADELARRSGLSLRRTLLALNTAGEVGLAHPSRIGDAWHLGPSPNGKGDRMTGLIDEGWMRAIEVLHGDLMPEEWADRIGCSVAEARMAVAWARARSEASK